MFELVINRDLDEEDMKHFKKFIRKIRKKENAPELEYVYQNSGKKGITLKTLSRVGRLERWELLRKAFMTDTVQNEQQRRGCQELKLKDSIHIEGIQIRTTEPGGEE